MKAHGVETGAKKNERDPGKSCLKLKWTKLIPNSHGPKGAEHVRGLALAGAPNARPGGPSAGGSEGRRVPQRNRSCRGVGVSERRSVGLSECRDPSFSIC